MDGSIKDHKRIEIEFITLQVLEEVHGTPYGAMREVKAGCRQRSGWILGEYFGGSQAKARLVNSNQKGGGGGW